MSRQVSIFNAISSAPNRNAVFICFSYLPGCQSPQQNYAGFSVNVSGKVKNSLYFRAYLRLYKLTHNIEMILLLN